MPIEKKIVNVQTFKLVRPLEDKDKCPPQSKAIVKILTELGGTATRKQMIEALSAPGVITTVQTPERIFGFYRPRLIEMGVMSQEEVPTEVEVEVPEKPAKAEKVAAAAGNAAGATANVETAKEDKVKGKRGEAKTA